MESASEPPTESWLQRRVASMLETLCLVLLAALTVGLLEKQFGCVI